MPKKLQGGLAPLAILVIVALVVVGGFLIYFSSQKEVPQKLEESVIKKEEKMMEEEDMMMKGQKMMEKPATMMSGETKTFNLTGRNFAFSQTEIRVKQGDKVKINFESTQGFHDWRVEGYNVGTTQVNIGGKTSVELTADKVGTFEYYCSVDSHRQFGMVGKLIVDSLPSASLPQPQAVTFSGRVLAGSAAPVIEYNQADFEKAVATKKLVVLYFYANWCPICRAEVPKMYEAFNGLLTNDLVAFRVNYNDDETDDAERNLARAHGVAYQHTKVFLKDGSRILKSPESWDRDRYIAEVQKTLSQ